MLKCDKNDIERNKKRLKKMHNMYWRIVPLKFVITKYSPVILYQNFKKNFATEN